MTSLENLSSWHSDWKSHKIVVYGLGLSGFSVADTLNELGSSLLVIADRIDPEHADLLEVLGIRFEVQPDLVKLFLQNLPSCRCR